MNDADNLLVFAVLLAVLNTLVLESRTVWFVAATAAVLGLLAGYGVLPEWQG